jgi:hypothetical protein
MGEHHVSMSMTGDSRRVVAEPVKPPAQRDQPKRREPVDKPQPLART